MRTIQQGFGIEEGGPVLPSLVTHEPGELKFEWDESAETADFAWRLGEIGHLDISYSKFEIEVFPYASNGYDEVQFDMSGFWNSLLCDEAGHRDSIHLDRGGDTENRCTGKLGFQTIGPGTGTALAEELQEGA